MTSRLLACRMGRSAGGEALELADGDNVAVALQSLAAGTAVAFGERIVTTARAISAGHKFALHEIPRGSAILKYGQTMGRATETIPPGEHVHVHNVEGVRGRGDLAEQPRIVEVAKSTR